MRHQEVVLRAEALNQVQVQAQVQNPAAGVLEASVKDLLLPAALKVHQEADGLEITAAPQAAVQLKDHIYQYLYLYRFLVIHITAATMEVLFFHHCSVSFC